MELLLDPVKHEYTLGGEKLPGVTAVLDQMVDFRFVKEADLERARQLGTAVHVACQLHDERRLDEATVHPVVAPYLAAYRRFIAEAKPEWHGIEELVYHEVHRYAGTLDRRGSLFGSKAVLDIKSGAPTATVGLQTAAYLEALYSRIAATADGCKRYALYLRDDETYICEEVKTSRANDFRTFLSALNLYNWRKSNGHR